MSTNESMHPATNPDGTCSDLNCPCQQWSKQVTATGDTLSDCDCPLHQMSESERTALIDHAIEAVNKEVAAGTFCTDFDHAWAELPEADRRVTEIAVAEKLYYAGRRDRETEMLREVNEILRGVTERIGREGRK